MGPSQVAKSKAAPFLCFSRCWRHKGGYHEPVPHLGFLQSGCFFAPGAQELA